METVWIPCCNLPVVVLGRGFQDVDGNGVTGVIRKAEHIWVHQGVLNEGQLGKKIKQVRPQRCDTETH